jgi:methylase of polypeptide subunit release factors
MLAGIASEDEWRVLRGCRVCEVRCGADSVRFVVSPSMHYPDVWSTMLLDGARKHVLDQPQPPRTIVEVGVGAGVLPVFLDRWLGERTDSEYVGLDLSPAACECARLNLEMNGAHTRFEMIGGGHLLRSLPARARGRVDLLVANLPQVPDAVAENRNDYYLEPTDVGDQTDEPRVGGLGLLLEMLREAKSVLASDGRIIFTLAGRCAGATITAMLSAAGAEFEVLETKRVPQDPDTRIDAFVREETERGLQFRFFESQSATCPIGARRAKLAMDDDQPVYYDLHVALARLC